MKKDKVVRKPTLLLWGLEFPPVITKIAAVEMPGMLTWQAA
jgi:hypothetical protein